MRYRYLIALGSNQRHLRHGRPEQVLRAALAALELREITVKSASPIIASAPLGPSLRRYANGADRTGWRTGYRWAGWASMAPVPALPRGLPQARTGCQPRR